MKSQVPVLGQQRNPPYSAVSVRFAKLCLEEAFAVPLASSQVGFAV